MAFTRIIFQVYLVFGEKNSKGYHSLLELGTSLRASSPGVPWDTARAPRKSLHARYPRTRPSYLMLK